MTRRWKEMNDIFDDLLLARDLTYEQRQKIKRIKNEFCDLRREVNNLATANVDLVDELKRMRIEKEQYMLLNNQKEELEII